jgi:MFS family permease
LRAYRLLAAGVHQEPSQLLLRRQALARPVSPGWGLVIALSLDQLVAWGVLYYAYAILFVPIAVDLAVSREFVAGAFSGALLVSGLLARTVGRALDRMGARPVLLAGAVAGLAALTALLVSTGPVTLTVAFALLGVAQALALYESAFRAVVHWFPSSRGRSRALLVVTSVAGFASTAFLPLTAIMVGCLGWRATVAGLGLLLGLVVVPIRVLLPKGTGPTDIPAHDAVSRAGAAVGAGWLATAFALHAFASTGVAVYLVWHFAERGWTMAAAAALAGLAGASQVPGRLLLAPLQGALASRLRIPLLFVVQAASLVGILAGSGVLATAAVMLFGAANGMMTLERANITVEWFGRDSFGSRSGDIASVSLVARAAAPFVVAILRGDRGYAQAFAVLSALLMAGALVMAVADRTRQFSLARSTTG